MASKALTPQQREAAAYVAIGRTDQEIADTVGIAKSTVATWRKRADFQQEVNSCVTTQQRMILRRSVAHGAAAEEFLRQIMDDENARLPERKDAAKALLARQPAIKHEHLAEPVPSAAPIKALPVGPDGMTPGAQVTLLEVLQELRTLEEARARPAVAARRYDEDDDEDQDDDDVIIGEVVHEEPSQEPEPVPVRQLTRRPKPRTVETGTLSDRELEALARSRGGLGTGLRGGGY